ncbi:MAG: hypothetical protein IJB57_09490 [Clostridia bacterium]|nr:hypothetical protein [Clostridia bacterium]
MKRILSLILSLVMIMSTVCITGMTVSSETPELTNWNTMAGKYSASTYSIIAPRNNDYKIKNDGFTFTETGGGVSVHTATYAEFAGIYGTSAITSKQTTPLDGLTVVIEPDDFDFTIDSNNVSSVLGVLWTEYPITEIAGGFDDVARCYNTGLRDAVRVSSNGLRYLIPIAEGSTHGVPVANANAENITGKALYISVTNRYDEYDGSMTASDVNIVYYDGSYINKLDGHPGYRWTFTARNNTQVERGDSSGISSPYMDIDLTCGLVVNVRSDETHGYIVNINGTDYYKGKRVDADTGNIPIVAYYPDAYVDGTSHPALTNDDYAQKTERYLNSMTYAKNDIDLTGLREAGEGYLAVGAVSINDKYLPDHHCDYTVSYVNAIPAADWEGEAFPADHTCDFVLESSVEANCINEGYNLYRCRCGKINIENSPVNGIHGTLECVTVTEPTCQSDGLKELRCSLCEVVVETEIIPAQHVYTEDILQAPTCTETGISLMMCSCGDYYTEYTPVIPHLFESYTYNNDHTCTEDGTKTAYCEYGCGTSDTVTAEGTAAHSYVEEIIRSATCTKTGIRMFICDCGDYYTEDISKIPHSYTDYTYNNDATCMADGTMTAYCDYGCGNSDTLTADGTKTDHSYEGTITTEPTCTATGVMTYTCVFCKTSYTEEIAMTGHNYIPDVLKEPTCTSTGIILYMCECRDYYTEVAPMSEHPYGDWTTVIAPTDSTVGEEKRECTVCGAIETRELPALPKPELSVDNYTITITNADYIKDMRYVLGTYTTTTEIRNAEGNVALDNKVVKNNTVDGKFVYDLPDGGVYSIWVRMTDGRNYILPIDMTKFIPTVDTYGVKITVDGLYDIKDFFIAKGEFNSYNEIKNNGYIVRVTANKIAGKHSYTYTVSEPGVHTILVRYNDGTEHIFHEELVVDEPVFTTNGLQVTVSNIPDVKVIRTAYGEYYTPGDTKRAEGARNFSNKAVIKDAESYMLQYREEGIVTIIVEYNNGYVKVFHYDVVKKAPTVEQNENSVTFGNLDGLVMIRYAVGEYSTSNEIKKAPGSKVIKPDAIVDGKITVSDLTIGETYTFSVQYDDESYSLYIIQFKEPSGRVLFWGDSMTQGLVTGYLDIAEVPYPERVGEILGVEIQNHGVGGETTAQIAERMVETYGETERLEGDILVIWSGMVECGSGEWRSDPITSMQTLCQIQQEMINYANTDEFVIIGLPATRYVGSMVDYNYILEEYWGAHFIDINDYMILESALTDNGFTVRGVDKKDIADGYIPRTFLDGLQQLHPNQAGYNIIAKLVSDKITELDYLYC